MAAVYRMSKLKLWQISPESQGTNFKDGSRREGVNKNFHSAVAGDRTQPGALHPETPSLYTTVIINQIFVNNL